MGRSPIAAFWLATASLQSDRCPASARLRSPEFWTPVAAEPVYLTGIFSDSASAGWRAGGSVFADRNDLFLGAVELALVCLGGLSGFGPEWRFLDIVHSGLCGLCAGPHVLFPEDLGKFHRIGLEGAVVAATADNARDWLAFLVLDVGPAI